MAELSASRPLTNARHERFAQLVVSGLPASQAHAEAGYEGSPRAHESNSSRLIRDDKVAVRIAELRAPAIAAVQAAAGEATLTAERVLREYARIAFSDMRRFATVTRGGIVLTDSAEWTDDDAAAVAELGETVSKEGGSVRFKLHSKVAALDALAKHLGLLRDPDGDDAQKHLHLHFESLSIEELRAIANGR